jgi:hypothetical protein
MGMKVPDWWACFGCQACHDAIDRRTHGISTASAEFILTLFGAVQRTLAIWFELGLLRVAGDAEKPRTKPTSNKIVPRPERFRR